MGGSIGQIPSALAGPRFGSPIQRAVPSSDRPEFRLGRRDPAGPTERQNPLDRPTRPPLRSGFGPGSANGPTAALVTLDRNVDNTRRLIPTPQESQAQLRARLAEARERRAEEARDRPAPRIERRLPSPSAQARAFVSDVNQAAETVQARLRGEPAPSDEQRGSIRVNGETVPVGPPGIAPPGADRDSIRLDVRV